MKDRELKKRQEEHFNRVKKEINFGQFENTIITGNNNTQLTQNIDKLLDGDNLKSRNQPTYSKIEFKDENDFGFDTLIDQTLAKHLDKQNKTVEDVMIKKISDKYKNEGSEIKEKFNFELIKLNNCNLDAQEVK